MIGLDRLVPELEDGLIEDLEDDVRDVAKPRKPHETQAFCIFLAGKSIPKLEDTRKLTNWFLLAPSGCSRDTSGPSSQRTPQLSVDDSTDTPYCL